MTNDQRDDMVMILGRIAIDLCNGDTHDCLATLTVALAAVAAEGLKVDMTDPEKAKWVNNTAHELAKVLSERAKATTLPYNN